MNDQYLVLTPDKVVVSYRLANVASRLMAKLLDLIFFSALVAAASILAGFLGTALGAGVTMAVQSVVGSLGFFAYFILQEGLWQGQTFGKNLTGLRVLSDDGTPVTFGKAFFRNLLLPADLMPGFGLVGLVTIFTNPRSQRIGDLAAGTLVVHQPRINRGFSPAPHRYGVHPFEHTVGDLRRMTLEEYFAIKRLCDRFPELTPEAQTSSLAEIWEPFAAMQGLEPILGVHPIYQMEAVVMKFGRLHKLI